MKKKILIMIMILFFMINFTTIAFAGNSTSFEDYAEGQQLTESWLSTHDQYDYDAEITDDFARTGDKSFRLNKAGSGGRSYFNFTDGNFEKMTFYFYVTIAGSDLGSWHDIYFYNDTGTYMFYIRMETDDPNTFSIWIDVASNQYEIIPDLSPINWDDEWHKLTITRISSWKVNVSVYDINNNFYAGQTVTMSSKWSLWNNSIRIDSTNVANLHQLYIDDLYYNEVYVYEEQNDYQDVGSLTQNWNVVSTFGERYWNQERQSPISGTIKRFEIPFFHDDDTGDYQYNDYGISLCINGHNVGDFTERYVYADSNNGNWLDILVWDDLSITLKDENLIFEVDMGVGSQSISYNLITAPFGVDVDGDSIVSDIYLHNVHSAFCNGMGGGSTGIYNREHLYKCYYITSSPYDPLDDTVSCGESIIEYKTIEISYTVNKSLSLARVIVTKDGTEYLNESCEDEFGSKYYVATNGTGTFTVNLNRNGATVKTTSFIVTAKLSDYNLYCLKTKFLRNEQFDVYYSYNKTYNNDELGYLRILDSTDTEIKAWNINTDDWEIYTITDIDLDSLGTYQIELGYLNNGSFIIVPDGRFVLEIVSSLHGRANIDVYPESIYLDEIVTISGKNPFTGDIGNVKIRIYETNYSWDISTQSTYNIDYRPSKLGTYTAQFVYLDAVIDEITFSVVERPPDEGVIFEELNPIFNAILGIIVIAVFTMLPMFISIASGKSFDPPPLVYGLCCGIGIVFSVLMGFIDLWIPAFITAIGIILVCFEWLRSKR